MNEPSQEQKDQKSGLLDLVQTFAIALAICLVIYLFLIQPHRIDGSSMEPTFQHGNLILSDKISYRFNDPKRGDVIVFHAPETPEKDFIKRIIGLPGEHVVVKNNLVYINGIQLDETYLPLNTETQGFNTIREDKEYIVPEKNYVVMGDNRKNSHDSRAFGAINRDTIVGRVWVRYWPLNEFVFMPKIEYSQVPGTQ